MKIPDWVQEVLSRRRGYTPSKHFSRREMGYTGGGSSEFRLCHIRSRIMNAVAVQYFDEHGGFWTFGYLEKADRTWAWVRPVVGRTVRVPVAQTREVEQAKKLAN